MRANLSQKTYDQNDFKWHELLTRAVIEGYLNRRYICHYTMQFKLLTLTHTYNAYEIKQGHKAPSTLV